MKNNKITPFLWFDDNAKEAVDFYASVFKDLKILNISKFDKDSAKASGQPEGSTMIVDFELFGQRFSALNGGPIFKFNESISFLVDCDSQEEIDNYWGKLSAVPESEQCGWLKDKFGLSWQIIPKKLDELFAKDKSGLVMKAMLGMKKINIKALQAAYEKGNS